MSIVEQPERDTASKPLLTPDEYLAEMRGAIGRNSLYGLLQTGRIRHVKIGRKILIPRAEITEFSRRETESAK